MVTFDSTDLDNAVSESGVVHESVVNTDHNNASNLKQGYQIENPYLSADLVGYWPLHEDSGSTAYDFGGANNGTLNGGVTQSVAGLLGTTGYSFDGVDDEVTIGNLGLSLPFTATFWFNVPTLGTDEICITMRGSYDFDIGLDPFGGGNDDEFGVRYYDGSTVTHIQTPINTDQWYFASITVSSSGVELFIDADSKGTNSNVPRTVSETTGFGGRVGSDSRYWDGTLTDVRVYSAQLSSSDFNTIHQTVTAPGTLTTQFKTV